MHELYFLAITFLFLTINPAAIMLCAGLSAMMGVYRFAVPVGAVVQVIIAYGAGDYAPGVGVTLAAAASGALLASLGVLIRQKVIEPRRKRREGGR